MAAQDANFPKLKKDYSKGGPVRATLNNADDGGDGTNIK